MFVDCNEAVVVAYQNERLSEKAAPKTVNDEVGFLLRILGDQGDLLRLRLKKRKLLKLKVGKPIGKAYTTEEKERMLVEARKGRSPHIYPAIMLAFERWHPRCGAEESHLGASGSRKGIPHRGQEQDGGRRRQKPFPSTLPFPRRCENMPSGTRQSSVRCVLNGISSHQENRVQTIRHVL